MIWRAVRGKSTVGSTRVIHLRLNGIQSAANGIPNSCQIDLALEFANLFKFGSFSNDVHVLF